MEEEKRKRLRSALDSLVCRSSPRDEQPAPGKGRPWDRNDLLHRLQSFRSSTWFAKPEGITPSQCARHGWLNTGLDTLGCEVGRGWRDVGCPSAAAPRTGAAGSDDLS